MQVDADITIEEIDEAIGYLAEKLKIDEYGNRMDWRKRQFLQEMQAQLAEAIKQCKYWERRAKKAEALAGAQVG